MLLLQVGLLCYSQKLETQTTTLTRENLDFGLGRERFSARDRGLLGAAVHSTTRAGRRRVLLQLWGLVIVLGTLGCFASFTSYLFYYGWLARGRHHPGMLIGASKTAFLRLLPTAKSTHRRCEPNQFSFLALIILNRLSKTCFTT